ncbi:hypothetical protein J6590_020363, partial [Homalodisca vitripennis]
LNQVSVVLARPEGLERTEESTSKRRDPKLGKRFWRNVGRFAQCLSCDVKFINGTGEVSCVTGPQRGNVLACGEAAYGVRGQVSVLPHSVQVMNTSYHIKGSKQ